MLTATIFQSIIYSSLFDRVLVTIQHLFHSWNLGCKSKQLLVSELLDS